MTERRPDHLPFEKPLKKEHIGEFADVFMQDFKALFDSKFPLFPDQAMGQTVYRNQIITKDNSNTFNLLYLPKDETRKDREEQIKISSSADNMTVIVKADKDNPEISYELFEKSDGTPERKIGRESNTYKAMARTTRVLETLSDLEEFDLVYAALDL